MKLTLKWTDYNIVPHTTSIYRSNTLPTGNPTDEPIVVLSNGETTWDDTTVTFGNVYYYTFKISNGNDTVFTAPVKATAVSYNGPGPQTLIDGDLDLGYYGTLTQAQLYTIAGLFSASGLGTGGTMNPTNTALTWHKFSRNGKTLFVPSTFIASTTCWTNLYNKGLVYGVDGNGPQNPGTGVNQKVVLQVGNDRFLIRLPTNYDDRANPNRTTPAGVTTADTSSGRKYSEAADLLWSLLPYAPAFQRFARKSPYYTTASMEWLSAGQGYRLIGQEQSSGNVIMNTNIDSIGGMSAGVSLAIGVSGGANGWRPILELIDD
jgi:hypothetical protein